MTSDDRDEQADTRWFKEIVSADDPWGPPLDILGNLYESIASVSGAQGRDPRLTQIESAARAAEAWLECLREFVISVLHQHFETSQLFEYADTLCESATTGDETQEIASNGIALRFNRSTAEGIMMFHRVWGEYPDVPITKGCEAFLPGPSHELRESTMRYVSTHPPKNIGGTTSGA
ncbi:hypothetical protein [Mycobacteroides chelonae]|uniref:Uncharacterized protein n=1 Tax=Mycobacteroides chelonae TaxID=1774 RepID=A0A1S1LZK8_MYCCH|nr:hypothetical protein [Mycobacteroides chelonae]OHU76078.1 hypothetical protein BKG84_24605 [Mycobacteroides chelonae]